MPPRVRKQGPVEVPAAKSAPKVRHSRDIPVGPDTDSMYQTSKADKTNSATDSAAHDGHTSENAAKAAGRPRRYTHGGDGEVRLYILDGATTLLTYILDGPSASTILLWQELDRSDQYC